MDEAHDHGAIPYVTNADVGVTLGVELAPKLRIVRDTLCIARLPRGRRDLCLRFLLLWSFALGGALLSKTRFDCRSEHQE